MTDHHRRRARRRALGQAQLACDRRRDARARQALALAPGASPAAATSALIVALAFIAWAIMRTLL